MAIAITGSTRGIGLAIATALVAQGESVVLHYGHDAERAAGAVAALESLRDGAVTAIVQADLTGVEEIQRLGEALNTLPEPLTGFVANAGPFRIEDWTAPDDRALRDTFHGNLLAPWLLLQAVMPQLRTTHGAITCIGQNRIQELAAAPRWTAYNAAKAGLVVLVRTIAQVEGVHGVRANLVNPGLIDTGHYPAGFVARMPAEIPLGRLGTPPDIANTIAWLHSPAASYVSGAVIDVNGGFSG